MSKLRLVSAILLIVGFLAVCSLGAAKGPIKIGVPLPMSPPGAYSSGNQMWWAVLQAVQEVNAAGGILGGRKVVPVLADNRGVPEEAKAGMERLITKDKVVAVAGNYHSSCCLSEMPLLHKYHIPFIAAECWANDLTAKKYPEIFRIAPTNTLYADKIVDWIKGAGFKSVAHLIETTDWGLGFEKIFRKKIKEAGINYKAVFADVATEDYTPLLIRFKQMEPLPDLFVNYVLGPAGFRAARQAYNIGFAPTPSTAAMGGGPFTNPEFWENLGEHGKYWITLQIGLPPSGYTKVTKSENEKFEAEHGRRMNFLAMEAYDSFMLIVEAIKDAGSTDPDAIIEALENIEWEGTRGKYYFPYGTHNPVPEDQPDFMWHQWPDVPIYFLQYAEVDQNPEEAPIIWPPEWAELEAPYYIPVPEE